MGAAVLTKFTKLQGDDRESNQVQDNIQRVLQPVLNNPILNGTLLKTVKLTVGANAINHGLGRALVGWTLTRIRAAAVSVYDTQDSNTLPNLTLNLTSNAAVTVDIYVF